MSGGADADAAEDELQGIGGEAAGNRHKEDAGIRGTVHILSSVRIPHSTGLHLPDSIDSSGTHL